MISVLKINFKWTFKLGVDRYVFFRADADTIITDQVDR